MKYFSWGGVGNALQNGSFEGFSFEYLFMGLGVAFCLGVSYLVFVLFLNYVCSKIFSQRIKDWWNKI
ncbi:hypothetical protein [Nitrosomonas sp. Nm58]|jgi:hypothetical protein|uniref:hypothetical protein n=1 Tax=Nitrosomonas sp. Nm58 TaxID=200126 RepID=UPI00089B34B7|nr:hypothetical protein [Nitrosomonas sp. Nm58]SDY13828.1 hypothetical protein SAMN05421754_100269 [Nitrosomonas sp. Nm58]